MSKFTIRGKEVSQAEWEAWMGIDNKPKKSKASQSGLFSRVNGREMSAKDQDAYFAGRPSLAERLSTDEGREEVVNCLLRDTKIWGGDQGLSYALAMTPQEIPEHVAMIQREKLVGVSVIDKGPEHPETGCVQFAGAASKAAYLKRRGELEGRQLVDFSSAGAGHHATGDSTKAQPRSVVAERMKQLRKTATDKVLNKRKTK